MPAAGKPARRKRPTQQILPAEIGRSLSEVRRRNREYTRVRALWMAACRRAEAAAREVARMEEWMAEWRRNQERAEQEAKDARARMHELLRDMGMADPEYTAERWASEATGIDRLIDLDDERGEG